MKIDLRDDYFKGGIKYPKPNTSAVLHSAGISVLNHDDKIVCHGGSLEEVEALREVLLETLGSLSMSSKTVTFKYNLGDELKDKVTGFKGVVMVRAQYATGCVHYGLQSEKLKDNAPSEWQWVDASRLELEKENAVVFSVAEDTPSGPFPAGPQS